MTTALVTGPSGEGFVARVNELRPNSILLAIDRPLQFRDRVKIDLLGTELSGEVVFAGEREAAVTFQMSPEIFDLIEAVESEREDPADELTAFAHLLADSSRKLLDDQDEDSAKEVLAGLRRALDLLDPKQKAPEPVFSPPSTADLIPAPSPLIAQAPAADDVPPLSHDGRTVTFVTRAQYAVQHEINIEKGALVVKAPPLPPGTRRDLIVIVPGKAPIPVSAQVMFQGPGTLGFSIAMNDALKATMRAALDDSGPAWTSTADLNVTGSFAVPRGASVRASPAIGYEADLHPPLQVAELLTLFGDRPQEISGTKGSYLRVLDFLLASEVDVRIHVSGDGEEIGLWLYHGRVVFTSRKPDVPDDLIGRRLVAARSTTRAVVEMHLPEVGNGKPIGTVLVEKGKLTQEALNPELRSQIMDRAAAPAAFSQGRVRVLPWTEPPIKSKLMPVSRHILMVELIKNELKRWPQEDLTKGLAKLFDYDLHVQPEKIDAAYKLGTKEIRFYQRVAQAPSSLGTVGTTGGAGPTEGLRLAVIGCALGFAHLERVDRERVATQQKLSTEDILLDQLQRTEGTTPFETLGIHWSASHRDIRAAYDAERKKLMMRKREDDSTRELVHRLEKRLDEALKILNSTTERKSIREASADAMERQHAAEHLVQQAEIAMFREEYESALDLLDTADELCVVRRTKQLRTRLERAI